MNRTHRILLRPTRAQRRLLEQMLVLTWALYNAALQERKDAWRLGRVSIGFGRQSSQLKHLADHPDLVCFGMTFLRWPLRRLEKAFDAFFDRVGKAKELRAMGQNAPKPGYPRFKSIARQKTFGYSDRQSWKLDIATKRLKLQGVDGLIRMKPHRKITGPVRSLQITRDGDKWYALVSVEIEAQAVPSSEVAEVVGIDVGINTHAMLSTGTALQNLNIGKQRTAKIKVKQRLLARAQRGSKKRRAKRRDLAREHARLRNARRTRLHQMSKQIVDMHPGAVIAFEDLAIRNMVRSARGTVEEPGRNVRQKSGLNRAIHDAAWGTLIEFTSYKAESAGGRVLKVDPRNTSQRCSGCQAMVPKARDEDHDCPHCGLVMGRDLNASLNIEDLGREAVGAPHRAVVRPGVGKLAA